MQMIKRRRQSKLPTQANFYPMAAGVFIEDEATRLSIHSAQALGVSSLASGQIEIMLDRRLSSDDNRGLQQGVRDNKRTVAHFRIVVEPMSGGASKEERVGFHSSVGHLATWSLHYPVVKMIGEATPKPVKSKNLEQELNCDLHVVTFRWVNVLLASGSHYQKQMTRRKLLKFNRMSWTFYYTFKDFRKSWIQLLIPYLQNPCLAHHLRSQRALHGCRKEGSSRAPPSHPRLPIPNRPARHLVSQHRIRRRASQTDLNTEEREEHLANQSVRRTKGRAVPAAAERRVNDSCFFLNY